MKSEKLQTYAHVAEIVGALAIIVSLIFVGIEVRQSNNLVANDSLREGTQLWVENYDEAFGTEESTAFMRRAVNDYQDLSQDEKGRFFALMLGFVAAYDNIYNQYYAGVLREDVFISIAQGYSRLLRFPGVQELLTENVPHLPDYLMDYTFEESLAGQEELIANTFKFLDEQ